MVFIPKMKLHRDADVLGIRKGCRRNTIKTGTCCKDFWTLDSRCNGLCDNGIIFTDDVRDGSEEINIER